MKKIEIIIGTASIIALILNLLLVTGGDVMTVLILSILSIFYLIFSLGLLNNMKIKNVFKIESYKEISKARIIGSVFAGIAFGITIIGILFKFQSYVGATIELFYGLFGFLIILVVGSIRYVKTKSQFYLGIFKRILIIGSLGFILIILPQGVLIDIKYRNYPEFAKALKNATSSPFNEEFQNKLQEEHDKMMDDK